ncbi:fimbrial protein [Buttiauxella sp. S04-F03]|uniref:fimbrial protein n=1 Tax=Buttiauxella sp. W03-F01 TaxID=2904524 RepID=UPI001E28AB27|nr:fimbrial protein [Buttiauxella sp. W03-F01]MCE0798784.1 fimbrial protein [Buttiauxella sp. W03-F01]
MNNKSLNILNLSVFSIALLTANIACADNKITFTGKVIDTACTVVVNDGTATLDLGETPVTDLAVAGQTGAPKTFPIALTACPAAAAGVPTKAYIKFSGSTEGDNTYFKNDLTDAAAADNVGILIKDPAGTAIINNDGNTVININPAGGDQTYNYVASLVATALGATKGNVSTAVTYNVSYE